MRPHDPDYDFILIGGGTAGCVLAARLTEDPEVRVLLLEAGPDASRMPESVPVPPAWPSLAATAASWGEVTVPQGTDGGPVALPRGRGIGGSSAINAMVFARGHRSSYDSWGDLGARGWSFDDLLPYFQRSETALGGGDGRGTDGPLIVAPAVELNRVLLDCLAGAVETGQRRANDISGGLEEGFAPVDLNIVGGRRQSAADAYLGPALHRPNLTVVTGALADRLILADGRCTGIRFLVDGRSSTATAAREVVLTAGAIGSAQLLLRSGIGPADDLRAAGVEVAYDLPGVGRNFHDHPRVNLVHRTSVPVPPGTNNHGEIIGLLRSTPELTGPDLQIVFIDLAVPNPVAPVQNGFTIGITPMRPASRGSVRITSADPLAAPTLDPRYFTAEQDVDAVLSGIATAREIARSTALASWNPTEVSPGPDLKSHAALADFARTHRTSYCHPVGTCALGENNHSVVDSALRLHGIEGIRIADASVIPAIPSNNTNATVYAIAERAADLLLGR